VKILITGAKGQVGSELVKQATLLGHNIIATDRTQLDISDQQAVSELVAQEQPNTIINAAAYTAVDQAESEQDLAYAINAEAVNTLAKAAQSLNIPLLHISTDYVFDGTKPEAYVENDPICPVNLYGASKRKGEEYLEASGVKYINLRTSWVFGLEGNNFVKTMIRLAKERDEFGVINDQLGAPTFAADIASALLSIAQQTQQTEFDNWGTYHFSGMPYVSWWEFADYAIQKAHSTGLIERLPKINKLTTDQYPTPAKRPHNSRMALGKIEQALGIKPSNWKAGVNQLLQQS